MEENPVTPKAKAAGTQPWENPQVRVAAVIILIVAVAAGLWLGGVFKSSKHHKSAPVKTYRTIGPMFESKTGLKAEALTLQTTFWWAGPQAGFKTEFTRNNYGHFLVRYLPNGMTAGVKGAKWTVIATYPIPGGFYALQKQAKDQGRHTVPGPGQSIIYVDQSDPRSVYMAWKATPDYQVVVYSPKANVAATIASSGKVQPISG